jgi:CxxC motif-containing protein (DUF1111 family)
MSIELPWRRPPPSRLSGVALALAVLTACETLLTEPPVGADVMDGPLPGLSGAELAVFARGDAQFERAFSVIEGLGPIFNDRACGGCHSGDGRGRPEDILIRIGVAPDFARALGGPQIQDQAVGGAHFETVPQGIPMSRRLPPPVFGVGLIEAISEAAILANADPDDEDGDGISGRPNWVEPAEWVPFTEPGGGPGLRLGRFSRKAQVSSLLQQTVEAYHQDMGITTDFLPVENGNPQSGPHTSGVDPTPDPEVPSAEVSAVLEYIRMLAPPAPAPATGALERGQTLFGQVGCSGCHTPVLPTGRHRIAALSFQSAGLYSDLLLHDMGEGLADGRPDGGATGREWRTAPLWGLRVMRDFLGGDAFLMHDGRARSVEEAILLHGGEAGASRDAFEELTSEDRSALVRYVETR